MGNDIDVEPIKVILFTGHMIDATDRKILRFPKEREKAVRKIIKESVIQVLNYSPKHEFVGISGGASGGDLLFLEVCKELGIKLKMLLALPAEMFIDESVTFAGEAWVIRFYDIYDDKNTEVSIMAMNMESSMPLTKNKKYSFWEQNNLWLLDTAFDYGATNVTLIALWNGKGEDGPGGTKHMIEEAKLRGATSLVIAP